MFLEKLAQKKFYGFTQGENIFHTFLQKLPLLKLISTTTHGAPAIAVLGKLL